MEYLAFGDDVALVAKSKDSIGLEHLLSSAAKVAHDWLTSVGLSLAEQKCEAMIITQTRTHNDINIIVNGHHGPSKKCIKYLCVHIDSKWKFTEHTRIVATRAGNVVKRLARIMTNINAAKRTKRKLLSNVAYSVMLYGAPVWADQMSATGWTELLKVQRRICLRVASGYCTISREAVSVITSIAPLNLLAKERKQIHDMKSNREQTQPQKTSWIRGKQNETSAKTGVGHTFSSKNEALDKPPSRRN